MGSCDPQCAVNSQLAWNQAYFLQKEEHRLTPEEKGFKTNELTQFNSLLPCTLVWPTAPLWEEPQASEGNVHLQPASVSLPAEFEHSVVLQLPLIFLSCRNAQRRCCVLLLRVGSRGAVPSVPPSGCWQRRARLLEQKGREGFVSAPRSHFCFPTQQILIRYVLNSSWCAGECEYSMSSAVVTVFLQRHTGASSPALFVSAFGQKDVPSTLD